MSADILIYYLQEVDNSGTATWGEFVLWWQSRFAKIHTSWNIGGV
ncbi:MAG: hypothetical protein PHI02_06255 [Sulfurovaceae bacterium]|nr:hypothetical protein [Sulfurovaceae bacterium]